MAPPKFAYNKIPARVTSSVGLEVRTSAIHKAGRGVFVLDKVPKNSSVFSISKLVLTVATISMPKSNACDNCFAMQCGEIYQTVQRQLHGFKKCEGCDTVEYCSQECKDQAWKKHHQYECKTLRAIKDCPKLAHADDGPMVEYPEVRYMVRLLHLRNNGKISNSVWDEVKSLRIRKKLPNFTDKLESSARNLADVLLRFIEPKETNPMQSRKEIVTLSKAVMSNVMFLQAPLINSGRLWNPTLPAVGLFGYFVDPFVSMINHCCTPNVMFFNEGRELRFRAIRDLGAGEEIVYSYCRDKSGDFYERKSELWFIKGIDCWCALCLEAVLGPGIGPLRTKVLEVARRPLFVGDIKQELKDVKDAITEMKEAGWAAGTFPLRKLHQNLLQLQLVNGRNGAEALKTCLTLYYIIEPDDPSSIVSYGERINTLYILISLLGLDPGSDVGMPQWSRPELPASIRRAARKVFHHLRAKLTRDIQACYGVDTDMAQLNQSLLLLDLEQCKAEARERLFRQPVALGLDEGQVCNLIECENFLSYINELLEWAGIAPRTLPQVCPEIRG